MTAKKERENKINTDFIGNLAIENVPFVKNQHLGNEQYFKFTEDLILLKNKRFNCTLESTGGYAAEIFHKRTFKADAIKKGYKAIDVKIGPRGGYGSKGTADLIIFENGKQVGEAGLKYTGKATDTAFKQSNIYDLGRQKICPSDQISRVKDLAAKRASTKTLKAKEYADTVKNASDKVKYKDIESLPLSKSKSMEIIENPGQFSKNAFMNDIKLGTKGGAIGGAIASGAISAAINTTACIKGDKEIGEVVVDVLKDTSVGTVKGALVGAGSQIINRGIIKVGPKALANGSAPIAIASTLLDIGIGITGETKKVAAGEENIKSFAINSTVLIIEGVAKGGFSFVGAKVGSLVGNFVGPIGTVVGEVLGGTAGLVAGEYCIKQIKIEICSQQKLKYA